MTRHATARDRSDLEPRVTWMFGSPRSGSTWLLRMLEEHPDVEAMNEPAIGYFLSPFLANEPGYSAEDLSLDTFTMRRVMEGDPERFFSREYADVWLPGLRELINARLDAHLDRECGRTDSAVRLIVKEPNGSQSADLIMRAQPTAGLLFLLRDGRDVVDSELASFLVGGWQERHFSHMRGVGDEERLDFVRNAAHQWLWRTEIVEAAFADHEGPKQRVRYEDLLAGPANHLAELFEWLGMPTEGLDVAAIAEVHAFERLPRKGADRQNRFATPGAWRQSLRADEREAVGTILGEKLKALGYEDA